MRQAVLTKNVVFNDCSKKGMNMQGAMGKNLMPDPPLLDLGVFQA